MSRGTQNTEDIDRAIASILKERAEFLGKSERALALEASVSRWRVNDIFTMKRPILVNELEELAGALGLVGSNVIREAEQSLDDQEATVIEMSATRALEPAVEADDELPDFTQLAARTVSRRPGWDASQVGTDAGEEPQD